jgi:NAD(P)-dependent dehydrogenase (short-subunit alcohol dehydrogenase family)
VFAAELARRFGDQGIVSTALNPGGIKTGIARHHSSLIQTLLVCYSRIILATPLVMLVEPDFPRCIARSANVVIRWNYR